MISARRASRYSIVCVIAAVLAGCESRPAPAVSAAAVSSVPAVPVASYQKPTPIPASHTQNGKHTAPDGASREDARQQAVLAAGG